MLTVHYLASFLVTFFVVLEKQPLSTIFFSFRALIRTVSALIDVGEN